MKVSTMSRRVLPPLVVALALGIAPAVAMAPAAPMATSACATQWGSLVKQKAPYTGKQITNVRSGRHQCFDRLVIDINADGAGTPGYVTRYVTTVKRDGSGARVPLRGGARLSIVVKAPAYNEQGAVTYKPANEKELVNVAGYRTFRQVAFAGTFEGQTTIGLGVRARLPMRTFVLSSPGGGHRVVIDVAHRW
jgi:hypothetical protein